MLEWLGNKWALVVRVKISENAAVRFNELSSKHVVYIRESAFACSQAIDRQLTTDSIIRRESSRVFHPARNIW